MRARRCPGGQGAPRSRASVERVPRPSRAEQSRYKDSLLIRRRAISKAFSQKAALFAPLSCCVRENGDAVSECAHDTTRHTAATERCLYLLRACRCLLIKDSSCEAASRVVRRARCPLPCALKGSALRVASVGSPEQASTAARQCGKAQRGMYRREECVWQGKSHSLRGCVREGDGECAESRGGRGKTAWS